MKDLYGKPFVYSGRHGLAERLSDKVRMMISDVLNLGYSFRKRPLIMPAALMLICSFACYYSTSWIPSVICSAFVFAAGCYYAFFSKRRKISRCSVIIITLLLGTVLIYIGTVISSRLRGSLNGTGPPSGGYNCVVTNASRDLSDDLDLTVRLQDGTAAKVRFNCGYEDLIPGDKLMIYGKIYEPDKAGNPGEFDYRDHLRKQGILYVISCDRYSVVGKAGLPASLAARFRNMLYGIRKSIFETVTDPFDETYKALAAAVCLGDRSLISDSIERDFKMSCCSHLLAVSGTHFSGFLVCVPLFMRIFNVKRKYALPLHAVFCILTGCLTGWSDSVTRAAVMSICMFANREWVSALCLAAVVMTAADPFCALSSGFQMSFCAVIAIKTYSERLKDLFSKMNINGKAAKVISTAVAAGLGIIPFWSDISMRPDPALLAVQIAGSFIAGAACTFFIPCVVFCGLFPMWDRYLSAPLSLCLEGLLQIVRSGSRLSVTGGMPIHLSKTLLVLLGISVFLYMCPPSMCRRVLLKPAAAVLAFAVGFEAFAFIRKPDCLIIFADVGQGDCCLIITPDTTCLIDAGTYNEGSKTVRDLLDHYGIFQVDVCIMSHWDADHSGGIAALCEQGRTKCIYTSYVPSEDDKDKDVEEFFESLDRVRKTDDREYHALYDSGQCLDNEEASVLYSLYLSQLLPVLAGDRIVLSETVYLDVLYPSAMSGGGNESSMVLMLHVFGEEETRILFTGDIGTATEADLIKTGTDLDCDILKIAHHGSKYSSSSEFIDACSPDIAVISVGARNLYGHPAPDTLTRLESYGCEVFRTDLEGAVMLEY